MIDGLLQGSPSYVSPLTDLESDLSASLNKSSDRRPQHPPHPQLHAHSKLLGREGLKILFFCCLIRYTPNRFIQLDFFFICVFLKRYRQDTAKIKCFTDSLPYSLYVFRDIGRPTDDFLNAMQIFCILLASMAQLYMKVPVKD